MLNIKGIALKVAEEINQKHYASINNHEAVWFAEALIAELAKQNEPVARLMHRKTRSLQESCRTVARTYEECKKDAYPDDWEEGKPLYTFPPTAEQIANETAWQPIETAPKDGSAILVGRFLDSDGQAYCNGRIAVDWYRGPEVTWGMFNKKHWPATHWMPLPTPPKRSMEGV